MCSSAPTCVLSRDTSRPQVPSISSEVEAFCDPMGNQGRFCSGILPAITRTSHDVEEGESSSTDPYIPRFQQQQQSQSNPPAQPSKSARAHRTSGWKTSKFFSRTMSSGEILRGLKKLSLTSSGSDEGTGEQQQQQQQAKPKKSKSGQLKKRSSCGNDDQPNEDEKARSPRSPGGFRPLSKAMSLSEPGSTGTTKTGGLGIVCKKEDLKAILCTATSGSSRHRFPLSSPRKKSRLRQTKSASFEPPADEGPNRKEPVRRAGSEESRTISRLDHNESKPEGVHEAVVKPPQVLVADSAAVVDKNALNTSNSKIPDIQQDKATAVKWDECEVVDAVIIGDAIESFLKGSMDKRVSFKRQHSDRKTKSDG